MKKRFLTRCRICDKEHSDEVEGVEEDLCRDCGFAVLEAINYWKPVEDSKDDEEIELYPSSLPLWW